MTPEDVVVREDGVAREVLKVTRSTEPVDITVLVDNSVASTEALQDMRLGLEKFVTTFAGPHPITLVTVADRPTVQVKSTTSKPQLHAGACKRLFAQPDAGATMNEAIVEASKAIGKRKPAHAAIVVHHELRPGVQRPRLPVRTRRPGRTREPRCTCSNCRTRSRADSTNPGVRDRNVVIDRGTTETGGTRELLLANLSITDGLQKVGRVATTQFEVVVRPARDAHSRPQGRGVLGATHGQGTGKHPAGEPDHTMTRAVVRQLLIGRRRRARVDGTGRHAGTRHAHAAAFAAADCSGEIAGHHQPPHRPPSQAPSRRPPTRSRPRLRRRTSRPSEPASRSSRST